MLRLSKKVEYGIMIIARLSDEKADLLSAAEIAKSFGISRPLVANVLKIFNRNKIVSSVRGVLGGYRLIQKPEEISLAKLIKILDGQFALTKCRHVGLETVKEENSDNCCTTETCPMKKPIEKVQIRIAEFLESIKCDQLIDTSIDYSTEKVQPEENKEPPASPEPEKTEASPLVEAAQKDTL